MFFPLEKCYSSINGIKSQHEEHDPNNQTQKQRHDDKPKQSIGVPEANEANSRINVPLDVFENDVHDSKYGADGPNKGMEIRRFFLGTFRGPF